MDNQIKKLVNQHTRATPTQLSQLIQHIATAPFAENLLEVEESLWSNFWQGDVIAPGYRLPAVELTFLRATRLDGAWPESTTVTQFLTDLRRAIRHPQAGVWTLTLAGEPAVVLAAPHNTQRPRKGYSDTLTVAWYCATTGQLHAGYRSRGQEIYAALPTKQRGLGSIPELQPEISKNRYDWLVQAVKHRETAASDSLAARLDLEILRIRAGAGTGFPSLPDLI
jgi:hypothetical protein